MSAQKNYLILNPAQMYKKMNLVGIKRLFLYFSYGVSVGV